MDVWQQFIDLLSTKNDQSWENYQSIYTEELLAKLNDQEWSVLLEKWRDFDERIQLKCASLLANVNQPRAIELAAAMIEFSPFDTVAFCAADSLRVMLHKATSISQGAISRIEKLLDLTDGIRHRSISELLKKLKV